MSSGGAQPATAGGAGMDSGCIVAVILASRAKNVIYERFYERFTDLELAEMRSACAALSDAEWGHADDSEAVSRFRCLRSGSAGTRNEPEAKTSYTSFLPPSVNLHTCSLSWLTNFLLCLPV